MTRYTDLQFVQDDEGIFDLIIDEDAGDFVTTDGLESAILVSLFSDRRAASDEVPDPRRRRGWIGNLIAEVPGDNAGSGLWLYEQKRLSGDVIAGLRTEAEQALEWMVDQAVANGVSARVVAVPANRQVLLSVDLTETSGDVTSRSYRLADATRQGIIARLGAV